MLDRMAAPAASKYGLPQCKLSKPDDSTQNPGTVFMMAIFANRLVEMN